jgi:hypothetical protein
LPSFLAFPATFLFPKKRFSLIAQPVFWGENYAGKPRRSRPFGQASLALSAALILPGGFARCFFWRIAYFVSIKEEINLFYVAYRGQKVLKLDDCYFVYSNMDIFVDLGGTK